MLQYYDYCGTITKARSSNFNIETYIEDRTIWCL
jgi:hypothetical protein